MQYFVICFQKKDAVSDNDNDAKVKYYYLYYYKWLTDRLLKLDRVCIIIVIADRIILMIFIFHLRIIIVIADRIILMGIFHQLIFCNHLLFASKNDAVSEKDNDAKVKYKYI